MRSKREATTAADLAYRAKTRTRQKLKESEINKNKKNKRAKK